MDYETAIKQAVNYSKTQQKETSIYRATFPGQYEWSPIASLLTDPKNILMMVDARGEMHPINAEE